MKERYHLFDTIRGISLISMVLYHFTYDVCVVYGKSPYFYLEKGAHIWQQSICWTFICLSGFVWIWGRKTNLKRGILLNVFGLIITAVTVIGMPSESIWFGVLNLIGCSVLLMIPLEKLFSRIPGTIGAIASFLLFLLCKHVDMGYLELFGSRICKLPDQWYTTKLLTPLGFPYPGFYSSDYFPILPWFFLFATGYFLNRVFRSQLEKGNDGLRDWAQQEVPLLTAIGQKSIWIYLAHQPICMLVCMIIFH